MHEIKCPKCGTTFTIDEAGYADILKQVRDEEFEKDLHERLELAEQKHKADVELAEAKIGNLLQEKVAARESEIERLKEQLKSSEVSKDLAVKTAVSELQTELEKLKVSVEAQEAARQLSEAALKVQYETQIKDRDDAIERLKDLKALRTREGVRSRNRRSCRLSH